MPAIKLTAFIGEQPLVIPRLMPENAAQSAINSRLDDGGLTPMRQSTIVDNAASADVRTLYKFGNDWLGWEDDVDAAPGPVADDRLYYTGDGVPKMLVAGTEYPLALAPPAGALTATLGGSGSGDVVTRIYAYTWVTGFGEESEPSPASNAINWQPGNTVTLSGFASTPSGRNITHQRIYRSQTGQSGTFYYLIAERAASNGNFSDTVAIDGFQEPLPSLDWNPPPDDLAGLISLPNGMMAAFVGKRLYFCEPYRPHAWPEKYALTTDAEIVGLGAMGTSVLVMTKAQPFMVGGATPASMQMEKIEQNFPCINARGIVDLGYAIAFPSNEGLVVALPTGAMRIATANIFRPEDWLALSPATMIGGQRSGRYVAFYSTEIEGAIVDGALLIDLSGQSYLIRADAMASAAFYDVASSSLFYLAKGTDEIMEFDSPQAARLNQYWKPKEFVLPYAENFGAIRIDADANLSGQEAANLQAAIAATIAANAALIAAGSIAGDLNAAALNEYPLNGDMLAMPPQNTAGELAVGIYADGELKITITQTNRIVRLPSGFKARRWEIDVFGDVQVEQIVMAKTPDEVLSTI